MNGDAAAHGSRDPVRYRRLLDLLGEALDQPAGARTDWLNAMSGDDAGFREDLVRLLAHRDDSDMRDVRGQIDGGAAAMAAGFAEDLPDDVPEARVAGQRIGGWILERPLGSGGMGMVWLAKKAGDAALPPVAIKLATTTRNARAAAERLQREGAILAALNHPNIARLIEVGVTDDGAPFLALEYIAGVTLPKYCDDRKLALDARLKLFVKVLDAVAYAHSTLVLHRDLKPGNVLVTEGGEVKLLDFGIAKLMDDGGTANVTQLTRLAGRAMTPDYASPEQIAGVPLTVASDVYSLGVMLFELLTGERPYRLKRGSVAELEEAILTADTSRPSTAVREEFAARNRDTLPRLRKKLAGDLDTIVLKALKKAPAERYPTAAALREDVMRFLDGRPVLATPDSFAYRARKFVGRNRLAVGAAAAILLALLAGLAVALWQAAEAREQARVAAAERARAEQRFNDVRAIANSLIFEVHDAIQYVPGATDARTLLTWKAVEFLDKVAAQNSADPAVAHELAAGYRKIAEAQNYALAANLGDAAGAKKNYEKAMALLEPLANAANATANDRAALALTALSFSVSLKEQGELPRALALTRQALEIRRQLVAADRKNADLRRDLATAESYMANALSESGDLVGALAANEVSLAIFRELVEEDAKSARNRWGEISSYANTGNNLIDLKRDEDARPRLLRAIELAKALSIDKPDHYSILTGFGFYYQLQGEIDLRAGQRDAAARGFEQALSYRRGLVARDKKDTEAAFNLQWSEAMMGFVKMQRGDAAGGRAMIEQAIAGMKELIKQRSESRRPQAALVRLLVVRGRGERAVGNERVACASFTEAAALLSALREKHPALHSVTSIEVPGCGKDG